MCVRPEYSARLVSGETSFYAEEAAYPVCSMDHQVGPAFLYSVIWSINKSFQDHVLFNVSLLPTSSHCRLSSILNNVINYFQLLNIIINHH